MYLGRQRLNCAVASLELNTSDCSCHGIYSHCTRGKVREMVYLHDSTIEVHVYMYEPCQYGEACGNMELEADRGQSHYSLRAATS